MTERVEPAFDADERTVLSAYLDYQRPTLVWKASGLTQAQLAQTIASSSLTIAGLVKHMRRRRATTATST